MTPTAFDVPLDRQPVIAGAVRTPIGRHGGALAGVRPDDLAALVLRALLDRTGIDPALVDDVYFGAANQAGEDNRNVARMAVLLAGLPMEVPGATVNRLCASSLTAVNLAAMAVASGQADVVVAGGVESMTRAPWVVAKPEKGFPRGDAAMVDTTLGWRLVNPRMRDLHGVLAMGETAECVAERYGVSRQDQDAWALAQPAALGARGRGEGLARGGRTRPGPRGRRRASPARHYPRIPGPPTARLPCRWHGHGRQFLRAQRRSGRRAGDVPGSSPGAGA